MPKQSSVAWLDFRAGDLARARDFIRALQDEGVLDELGFLALQGKFADIFHPATSTLMRSARYLYFVAGIYRQLEHERVTSANIGLLARRRQDALRDVLAVKVKTGVIGRDAKLQVKQLPSTVYWSSLRKLEMFTAGMSEGAYWSTFDELRAQRRGYVDDDKTAQGTTTTAFWDSDLPSVRFLDSNGAVQTGTDFGLTRSESQDLSKRYRSRFPQSLLTHLVDLRLPNTDFPWSCPKTSEYLAVHLKHARALSLFARGATLQYYQLVLEAREKAGMSGTADLVAPAFKTWWTEATPVLRRWSPDALTTLEDVAPALRPGPNGDLSFIVRWMARLSTASTATALLGDSQARELVYRRELSIKPAKARLKHRKHLEQWRVTKVTQDIHQFDYRHGIGSRFVSEILKGDERQR